ncbi:major facilitator superfamily domain-containing protein [Podospora australis]|uniref:Major facilitator superfamily domain-containing protein n=1 Tax=Podospora australis TaxID=1536484 RepID=A0AAN6WUX1_9PEZI|nr:major facilitator superfamily domain-containing protein [Podospora australis]
MASSTLAPSSATLAPSTLEPSSTPENSNYTIYTPLQKRLIVTAVAVCGFFNPLTAQVYLPALNVLASEFHVTPAKINLTVTTYMVFQGITPILFSGFTDTLGRRPGYIICFAIYLAANIACALASDYTHLLIIRCFQSAGSATIMVLCQAVIADIITSAERGGYVAITAIPSILGPSLGPVIGGAMTRYLGWRSIFWMLTICAAVNFFMVVVFLPETCRKVVGDGSVLPKSKWNWTLWQLFRHSRRGERRQQDLGSLEQPTHGGKGWKFYTAHLFSSFTLLREKELVLLLLIGGTVFTGVYAIGTAMPHQFKTLYDFNDFEIGLLYLPMAGGSILAVALVGPGMNWNYRRHAKKLGMVVDKKKKMDLTNFPIEKVRLEIAMPLLLLGVGVVSCWGWVAANKADIEEVCALVFSIGVGLIGVNNAVNALIVDIFPGNAGAALAAYNMVKCLMGAVASGAIAPMIKAMGMGKAFMIFGILYLLLGPVVVLVMKRGIVWRRERQACSHKSSPTLALLLQKPREKSPNFSFQSLHTAPTTP